MVKEEEEDWQNEWADDHKDFLRGIRGWRMSVPKLCDVCQVSGSVMFCRAHSAHLCMVCDVKIHVGSSSNNNNRRSSSSPSSSLCHERVWLCEVCEQAPASVTCKADAAALCVSCDSDIHSANPLARKHERIPVTPFYESPNMGNNNNGNKFSSLSLECNDVLNEDHDGGEDRRLRRDDEEEECNGLLSHRSEPGNHEAEMSCAEGAAVAAASWLIPEAGKNNLRIINGVAEAGGGEDKTVKDKLKFKAYLQSIDFLEDVDDPYVGFEYLGSNEGNTAVNANAREALAPTHLGATDSMVPVHTPEVIEHSSTKVSDESGSLDADLSKSNYGYRSASLNNSVSSCIDVGIVPETSMNEIYNEGARGSFEIPPRVVHNPGTQFEAMGREARVLRYREKRKNRKFEKTIRYASRKAYAETRPRIKGRFAKRTDVEEVEGEVERMYSSSPSVLSDQGYGVVPSF